MLDQVGLGFNESSPRVGGLGGLGTLAVVQRRAMSLRGLLSDLSMGGNGDSKDVSGTCPCCLDPPHPRIRIREQRRWRLRCSVAVRLAGAQRA